MRGRALNAMAALLVAALAATAARAEDPLLVGFVYVAFKVPTRERAVAGR